MKHLYANSSVVDFPFEYAKGKKGFLEAMLLSIYYIISSYTNIFRMCKRLELQYSYEPICTAFCDAGDWTSHLNADIF